MGPVAGCRRGGCSPEPAARRGKPRLPPAPGDVTQEPRQCSVPGWPLGRGPILWRGIGGDLPCPSSGHPGSPDRPGRALTSLGGRLREFDLSEEALEVTGEAVALRRELADTDPARLPEFVGT